MSIGKKTLILACASSPYTLKLFEPYFEFLSECATFLEPPCYVNLLKKFLCCVCVCVCVCANVKGVRSVPIISKNCHPFPPPIPFINTVLSNENFYIFLIPLFITTTLPATFLINHILHLPLEDENVN